MQILTPDSGMMHAAEFGGVNKLGIKWYSKVCGYVSGCMYGCVVLHSIYILISVIAQTF